MAFLASGRVWNFASASKGRSICRNEGDQSGPLLSLAAFSRRAFIPPVFVT